MIQNYLTVGVSFILIVLMTDCSSSTGTRYEGEKNVVEETTNETQGTELDEDFDMTPYKTEIDVEEEYYTTQPGLKDVWYGYDESASPNLQKNIIGTADGFRVQIISTDNIDVANQTRSEVYFKISKESYVSFEPPFYKVKVGDFTSRKEANDLKFKLNQLGYSEARVVQETVNIFE